MAQGAVDKASRTAAVGMVLNGGLMVAKLATGVLGHSYALVADGVESLTDLLASVIVWRGIRTAARDPDSRHPFGYGKAESVSAAAVALILILAGVGICVQAVREIATPHHGPAPFTLYVLIGVILIKLALSKWTFEVGQSVRSPALLADAWHHRADAITSGAAFIGISVALLGGDGWHVADDWAALVASAVILLNGGFLLRGSVADLMDAAPSEEIVDDIARRASLVEGVIAIEKAMVRRSGGGYRVVLHVEADRKMTLERAHVLGGRVRSTLRESADIVDVVVHMEPHLTGQSDGASA